jgi:Response regulator of the LytR/AlgR family
MYHIALCDDAQIFINYMKTIIKTVITSGGLDLNMITFYEYHSGEELIHSFNQNIDYDLLVLDMQMGKLNGNETAKLFREKYPNTTLVFCSGKVQPTVESFEVTPFRYLLKQYGDNRMQSEMKPVIEKMKSMKSVPSITCLYKYNAIKYKPNEILYIAATKRGSNLFVLPSGIRYGFENCIKSKEKVKDLYPILKDHGFMYAHNSYIVNLNYIKRKTTAELELIDGTVLSIARSKEKALRLALAVNLAQKYE